MTNKEQTISWIVTGIAMLLGLYNQLAITQGWVHLEFADAQLTQYVTWFYELVVGLIAFWRNNNITSEAKVSQIVLDALKSNVVTDDQILAFLESEELQDIADAHNNGQDIEVEIIEPAQVKDQRGE